MRTPKSLRTLVLAASLLSPLALCHGQGKVVRITFDGPPVVAPGTAIFVQQYYESGILFRPIGVVGSGNGFVRRGTSPRPGWPDDGTAYVQASLGDSLMFSSVDGSLFDLSSVDVAGYSAVVPDVTAYFIGYRADGSTVTTSFLGSGLVFSTLHFGPEFSNLVRVEVPDFGSLDNLVISIPEPSTGSLLTLGALLIGPRLIRRRRP
jgi:hypothetical protein